MTSGVIMKVVRSYGSEWGRFGQGHECFFNRSSLVRPNEFDDLALGQEVKFVEEADRVNGTRAVRMSIIGVTALGSKTIRSASSRRAKASLSDS
jgi:cold shock CspA family protein